MSTRMIRIITLDQVIQAAEFRLAVVCPSSSSRCFRRPIPAAFIQNLPGVLGGESGGGARPCNLDWIRSGINQCHVAGVKVFVKQLGSQAIWNSNRLISKDAKGGDMSEWPEELRIREFPE